MKKLSFTSGAFTGEVLLVFNDLGLLVSYDATQAQLSEKQQRWFNSRLPQELSEVKRVLSGSSTAKLTELSIDVTFELFWHRYNAPRNSKKIPSERCWNRLSQAQRNKAFYFIPIYESHMEPGVAKLYAETYLNSGPWRN